MCEAHRLCLDGDAALALEVELVEDLILHVAQRDGAGRLEQPIRKRRLAVIDVCDDAEVADPVEAHQEEKAVLGSRRDIAVISGAQDLRNVADTAPASGQPGLDAVRKHQRSDVLDVLDRDSGAVLVRGKCLRGLACDDVRAMAVDLELDMSAAMATRMLRSTTTSESTDIIRAMLSCTASACSDGSKRAANAAGSSSISRDARRSRRAGARHLALDVDAESETIEQLGTQLALLEVHRADEDESRRMRHRDALALDGVLSHRSSIEQHVDDVIVERVAPRRRTGCCGWPRQGRPARTPSHHA